MKNLADFIGPVKDTPPMKVEVIDINGKVRNTFEAPPGFQLERYVDSLYPEKEFMAYELDGGNRREVNITVLENEVVVEIYRGVYK